MPISDRFNALALKDSIPVIEIILPFSDVIIDVIH